MTAFALLMALTPVAAYLAIVGLVRWTGVAIVTTSAREIAALAMAASGFLAIGPAQLFFPSSAALLVGPAVWLTLASLLALVVTLIGILRQPSLIVFGRTSQQTFPVLVDVCRELDPQLETSSDVAEVYLPSMRIRLRIDPSVGSDACRVTSFPRIDSIRFWQALLVGLRRGLGGQKRPRRFAGAVTLCIAVTLVLFPMLAGFADPVKLVGDFREWLFQ